MAASRKAGGSSNPARNQPVIIIPSAPRINDKPPEKAWTAFDVYEQWGFGKAQNAYYHIEKLLELGEIEEVGSFRCKHSARHKVRHFITTSKCKDTMEIAE